MYTDKKMSCCTSASEVFARSCSSTSWEVARQERKIGVI